MKNIFLVTLMTLSIAVFSSTALAEPDEVVLSVQQMSCATCPIVVRGALYDLGGVSEVKVWLESSSVQVKYDADKVDVRELVLAVTNAGFPAEISK